MSKTKKKLSKKWYLIGYILIAFGVTRFGIRCYDLTKIILYQHKHTLILVNGIETIGNINLNYINLIFVFSFLLLNSIVYILLGILIINKKESSINPLHFEYFS